MFFLHSIFFSPLFSFLSSFSLFSFPIFPSFSLLFFSFSSLVSILLFLVRGFLIIYSNQSFFLFSPLLISFPLIGGGGATIAMPSTHMQDLFGFLLKDVIEGHWRAAYCLDGRVASVMFSGSNIWRLLTHGWKIDGVDFRPSPPISLVDFKKLESLSIPALAYLARERGFHGEGSARGLTLQLSGHTEVSLQLLEEKLNTPEAAAENCPLCKGPEEGGLCGKCKDLKA